MIVRSEDFQAEHNLGMAAFRTFSPFRFKTFNVQFRDFMPFVYEISQLGKLAQI